MLLFLNKIEINFYILYFEIINFMNNVNINLFNLLLKFNKYFIKFTKKDFYYFFIKFNFIILLLSNLFLF